MTFEELDQTLPNGFHDAQIRRVAIDDRAGIVTLDMGLWVGKLGSPNQEEYQHATVTASGLAFCSIDAPDSTYPYLPDASPVSVSGDTAKLDHLPELAKLQPTFPEGVLCYRFFVNDWNSFIHIAAKDVQIVWGESWIDS